VFAGQATDLMAQRQRLLAALRAMPGLKAWNSDANMILVRVTAQAGEADAAGRVFERLKAGGVLVKNVSKMHPLLSNCLRLTVGTEAENTQLLATLEKAL
jgi:histidinol-phosphate aminotransferase